MRSITGVVPQNVHANLKGYACYKLFGVYYLAIISEVGAQVPGILYSGLLHKQVKRLDAYESSQYHRVSVEVVDSQQQTQRAWSYVLKPGYYHRLNKKVWFQESFASNYLDKYISCHGWR